MTILGNVIMEIPDDWRLINHKPNTSNYCAVYEDSQGRLMVTNLPANRLEAKLFFNIIKKAESNKKHSKYIGMRDIVSIANSTHDEEDHHTMKINISGMSMKDIPEKDIECYYRFPIDKCYLVKLRNGSIIFTSERNSKKGNKDNG